MRKSLNFILFQLVFGISFAQQQLSLEEAKSYALEHNISIQRAALNNETARQKMIEVRGMGLPQVNLNASMTNYINIPVQVVDATVFNPSAPAGSLAEFRMGTDYTASGTLQVNQLIFNGSYIVGLQVASFYRQFEVTNTELSKEDVIFNVIQAYELAAVAKESMAFLDSLVLNTSDLVEKQKQFVEVELALQEDLDQLNYSLSVAKNAALNARIQYENALALLKYSIGYPLTEPLELSSSCAELMGQRAIPSGALTDNLSLLLLDQKKMLSSYNLKNRKYENLPYLNGFFQHTYNAFRNDFSFFSDGKWYPQTLWGLQLTVPVFSGLQRHAKVQQAEIQLMQDDQNRQYTEQALQFQEIQHRNNFQAALARLELEEENLKLAKSIYTNALIREEVGKTNNIVVTQKYNQLIQAQTQLVSAQLDLFSAKLKLDKLYNNILSDKL
jgi:outer membrane protein TolC